ncbi:MAG: 16S rRNA (adenine(1518)-N(6)/adenine(1519)-N(6))-dimethyltransferase RsmA [Defluviitaleaceae bacterium]|nr:16S rRNA (adenine(1518)-N(6)/adenine(1519)-N(6))-dimethyltransferase RsmA [Defluviitaleaceae bacterium]MCL2238552.1 16S rRNA (adenine(1518)-N(6)/adenine(1519)-N(6))-dimethyltransferase RsmA [Defluviitaleaceae bacterium]
MKHDILTPSGIRALLAQQGLAPRKKWGQHFLIDTQILQKIILAAAPDETDCVLEIGPGLGALTHGLVARAGHVLAVELDKGLTEVLTHQFREQIQAKTLEILQGDVLKLDIPALLAPHRHMRRKVVANLPYYITTPVILRLLELPLAFSSITIMIQKEVARRMSAAPGTKDYGSLTLAVAYHATTEVVTQVPASAFMPRPEVDSAVICLRPLSAPPVAVDKALLFKIIHAAFGQRRKTLVNALFAAGLGENKESLAHALTACALRTDIRGEALDIFQFARLTEALS